MRWRWRGGLAAASILALTSPAAAVEFDANGVATLAPDALQALDFEGDAPTGFSSTTDAALEGKQSGQLKGLAVSALPGIPLSAQHSLVATLFAHGAVNAYLVVHYKKELQRSDALVPLFATGRVTSDGWYELGSSALSVDAQDVEVAYLYAQNLGAGPADLDAVEVVDTGAYQQAASCAPPDDASCGAGRVCQAGVCLEADAAVPPLPPTADERAQVAALLGRQIDLFFGGLKTRKLYLPKALAALATMPDQKDAWSYWRQLLAAMHALHDAHTYGYVGYFTRGTTGACFVEGDGDLSHAVAPSDAALPDILVSHAMPDMGLSQGDRLVAVNGLHPVAFMNSLAGRYAGGFLGSDEASHSYAAESLAAAIPTYASTITVVSCPGGVCAAPKTIQVASLPTVDDGVLNCDNRVGFHFASGNPDASTHILPSFLVSGPLAGTTADEALYGAAFDSFSPDGATDPFTPFVTLATDQAKGLIIDHRKGYGGFSQYAAELSAPLRKTLLLGVTVTPQTYRYDPDFDQAKGKALFDAKPSGSDFTVGSDAPKAGLKAAVLIANSESSGDFFAFGMKGPSNLRVFGRRSQGAFSTAYYLGFGPMSWGFGSGETFEADGTAKIGQGALPDEEVLPKQSDLVKGVDTAYERALIWLRTCTDCDGETK